MDMAAVETTTYGVKMLYEWGGLVTALVLVLGLSMTMNFYLVRRLLNLVDNVNATLAEAIKARTGGE